MQRCLLFPYTLPQRQCRFLDDACSVFLQSKAIPESLWDPPIREKQFKNDWRFAYDYACYHSLTKRFEKVDYWLKVAKRKGDPKEVDKMFGNDPDFIPYQKYLESGKKDKDWFKTAIKPKIAIRISILGLYSWIKLQSNFLPSTRHFSYHVNYVIIIWMSKENPAFTVAVLLIKIRKIFSFIFFLIKRLTLLNFLSKHPFH